MEENVTPQPTPTKNYLYIIGVMGVLAILIGGYAFKNQVKTEKTITPVEQNMPATNSPVVEKEVISEVKYTTAGFSPVTLTVKKGTTVKFVNTSGQKMSVASDPHPSHTNYPEFDQFKSDAKGKDEYSFVFDKAGAWGYHDHFKASNKGTVVVTE